MHEDYSLSQTLASSKSFHEDILLIQEDVVNFVREVIFHHQGGEHDLCEFRAVVRLEQHAV